MEPSWRVDRQGAEAEQRPSSERHSSVEVEALGEVVQEQRVLVLASVAASAASAVDPHAPAGAVLRLARFVPMILVISPGSRSPMKNN